MQLQDAVYANNRVKSVLILILNVRKLDNFNYVAHQLMNMAMIKALLR